MDICLASLTVVLGGIRKYLLKQSLDHLPIICIVESDTPAAANAVAPPILKECVLNPHVLEKQCVNKSVILPLVRKVPLENVYKGPCVEPLLLTNVRRAMTGTKKLLVTPINKLHPLRNGSDLDDFKWIITY